MKTLWASASLAVLAAVGAVGAPAAADAPVFAVTGSGPSVAEFVVSEPVVLDYGDAVIAGTGRYAGIALWAAAGSGLPLGGVLASRDLDSPARPAAVAATTAHAFAAPAVLGRGTAALRAGRYRVYLLADGPAEVRIPIRSGSRGITVRPSTPTPQSYAAAAVAPAPTATRADVHAPLAPGRSSTRYAVLARWTAPASESVRVSACLTVPRASCAEGQVVGTAAASGVTVLPVTTGVGARRGLLRGAVSEARAEARFARGAAGSLALVVVAYG